MSIQSFRPFSLLPCGLLSVQRLIPIIRIWFHYIWTSANNNNDDDDVGLSDLIHFNAILKADLFPPGLNAIWPGAQLYNIENKQKRLLKIGYFRPIFL